MSARGVDFLKNWIQKNVPTGGPPDDPLSASNLAKRCITEAASEGFTLEEIQPETSSVESYIADAMVHPANPGISNK